MPDIDFEADIKAGILALIPDDIVGREAVAHMAARDVLNAYYNWMSRLVPPMPRRVHRSTEVEAAISHHPEAEAIASVLAEIERGDDLQARLSSSITVFRDEEAKAGHLHRRRDLDLMLADWGVHHLHLGMPKPDDFFVERTDDLLFVSFVGHQAYAIAVLPHGNWASEDVLRIMAENWPDDEGVIWAAKGIVGLAETVTQEERNTLRRSSVAVLFEHNGRVFMPRGGLTLGGTSMTTGLEADKALNYIWSVDRLLKANPRRLNTITKGQGNALPAELDWHLDVLDNIWRLHERNSGSVVLLQHVIAFFDEHPADHACEVCEPPPVPDMPG